MLPVRYAGPFQPKGRYPFGVVNVTNRCNLRCEHCFIFREGNPTASPEDVREELPEEEILETLAALRDRHGIQLMLWMGGEPMLRKSLVRKGVSLFAKSHVVTNGTVPLEDLGPDVLYVVSLDGPAELNDRIRGQGVFQKVLKTLERVPPGFGSKVQVQCVVTRKNQHALDELVEALRRTRVDWMTFTFHVPAADDQTGNAWPTLLDRKVAVDEVRRLKVLHPGFVKNSEAALALMEPDKALAVTRSCPAQQAVLPFYLEADGFTTPQVCCYGNDVDCDRCGAWVVFQLAALREQLVAPGERSPKLQLFQQWLENAASGATP